MKHLSLISFFALLLLVSITGLAEEEAASGPDIYVEVDESGVPSFSDTRGPSSAEFELREPTIYSPPEDQPANRRDLPAWKRGDDEQVRDPQATQPVDYTAAITSPEHDTAVRSNSGDLVVQVKIAPALQSGYRGELLLNGLPVRPVNFSGPVTLSALDRGTHQLQVRLFGPNDKVIHESSSVTVTILRASKLH